MSTTVINFVFESGVSLIIFTLVYLLFLRKETFFVLNRIYLMAAVLFSVLLPFVHFQANSALPSFMLGASLPAYRIESEGLRLRSRR